ncbi:DUF4386 family protein [Amorphoplanes digitatis]|uniref:DUF4386 family protein n=1 Tax=Actinoplanes digitatis TaxID=1868 RepID=A0A7W7MQ89_9ACTN|nr:DUF4386 family protein [Actinoplanes digitatis]MBB4762908.1 hypothetical protein [Actinoplanes digitatis]BFE71858.1 hypothetical protein GCM10020092_051590 [Actinoplanes digitatis]GID91597.1 hypothetical protein Adi01nite_10090 [Actinoplanes digitatis]
MNAAHPKVRSAPAIVPDASWRDLYRIGGWCGILIVVPYLAAMVAVAMTPPPAEAGAAETLEHVAAHKWLYGIEQVLWIAPGVLAMVVFLALTAAMWRVDKAAAAIAGTIGTTAWALTLALPTSGGGSLLLLDLADRYQAAGSDAQRDAYVTLAQQLIAENDMPGFVGVLTTVGILLISLVMTKGGVPRWVAWLGVATGAIGIVSEALRPLLGAGYAVYGTLLLAWFLAVGVTLRRLAGPGGRPTPDDVARPAL